MKAIGTDNGRLLVGLGGFDAKFKPTIDSLNECLNFIERNWPMDIKDFKARKKQLESDIASSISKLLSEFKEDTGYSPSNIYVAMSSAYTVGVGDEYYDEGVATAIKI